MKVHHISNEGTIDGHSQNQNKKLFHFFPEKYICYGIWVHV